jgi:hypothetical protein
MICTVLLFPLYVVVHILIPLITQVIKTVCSWVTSVIEVITQVLSKVCSWMPWPLSELCNWVTTLVKTLKTITEWVCKTVIDTITTFISWFVSLLIYVARVVCIVIHIIIALPGMVLCWLGLSPWKVLRVCIKILVDDQGNSAVTGQAIEQNIARMQKAYAECGIRVVIEGIERIVKPEYLSSTDSSGTSIFSGWHQWFTQRACWCCNQLTVFVVDKIIGASGFTFWGDNWCRVDVECNHDDSVMAHEIGHLLNLPHVSDPNNVMTPSYSPTSHHFNSSQCCLMKSSPFTTYI